MPEQLAAQILSIFTWGYALTPGKPLLQRLIYLNWMEFGYEESELEIGLAYAVEHDWLKRGPHSSFYLTDEGFNRASP